MSNISQRLKEWAVREGLRQVEIAERLGKSATYVSDLLNGRCRFGRQTAHEWNRAFGLSEEWLLTGEGGMFPGEEAEEQRAALFHDEKAPVKDSASELAMMRQMLRSMMSMHEDMRRNYSDLMELYKDLHAEQKAQSERMECAMTDTLKLLASMQRALGAKKDV